MGDRVDNFRKALWHLRTGGPRQLKRWNNNRLATTSDRQKRHSFPRTRFSRRYPSLTDSWKGFSTRQEKSQSAAENRRNRNPFAQGWTLSQESRATVPERWPRLVFGNWEFRHDPELETHHHTSTSGTEEVLLLGHATDSQKKFRSSRETAPDLLKAVTDAPDWKLFDDAVTWLGGRFIAIGRRGASVRVHVDAMASRSCYWGSNKDHVVLASHSTLVAQALGNSASAECHWVLTHPDYENPAGKYLPGMITPHDAAKLVFANCALTIENNIVSHRRFFFTPPEKLSIAEATGRYLSELRFQMDAALNSRPESVLALTAGSDSRAILAGTLDLLHNAGTSTMTYHFFARNADHSREDLLGANRLAYLSNLTHRILDVSGWDSTSSFARMYSKTFPTWARFPSLAKTYYEELGADESLIIGVGGEIGTVFYRDREYDQVTPEVLAGKYTQSAFQRDPRLIETMSEYIDYTELTEENSAGYDLFDLFYWEHRMSTWAAYGYAEADFGPQVVLPLNSRRLIHAMLSLPFKDRLRRSIYRQLAAWSGITE